MRALWYAVRVVVAGSAVAGIGCKSEADRACLDQFTSSQATVLEVKAEDLASVDASVAAIGAALRACEAAGRGGEVEELTKAHNQLSAHKDRLVRRAEMLAQRTELAPGELEKLVSTGDPKCPRGQGYLHGKSGKRIRCVGPQPIDMTSEQAEQYFKGRGYKLSRGVSPLELRFEYGAELLVFSYSEPLNAGPPRCVALYPSPDMSWQEATARLTGASPARLSPGRPIVGAARPLALKVEESAQKVSAHIGDCSG
jgi:hypothetical protein